MISLKETPGGTHRHIVVRVGGLLAVLLTVVLTGVVGGARGAPTGPFAVVDLGTLGGTSGSASAINSKGQVVGMSSTVGGDQHAFSWTRETGMLDLGTLLDGTYSDATDVNENGRVVGYSYVSSPYSPRHAFSWTQAGGMVDLGTLGGTDSWPNDVSDAGQVVGSASTASAEQHAFSWTQAGGMVDLGTLGGNSSSAEAVTASGQVFGTSTVTVDGSFRHAFSWTQAGGMVDLGDLGRLERVTAVSPSGQFIGYGMSDSPDFGLHAYSWTQEGGTIDLGTFGGPESFAYGVTPIGQVVGNAMTADFAKHAFLWTQVGGMVDLGTLGGRLSSAAAINDEGQVVGYSRTADNSMHPFSWTQAGGMVDLGTLGGTMTYALAVNNAGQVVGTGTTGAGEYHPVLWQPSDRTPPDVTTQGNLRLPATSASGATVTFHVFASDAVDGRVAATCTPPSGSLFPIGTATVLCTATDTAGNIGNTHFSVHVKGAPEQLVDLIGVVDQQRAGPGTSLHAKLVSALDSVNSGNIADSLNTLDSFISAVKAQSGKSIAEVLSEHLINDALRIEAVIAR